jgi:hypothetical protein
MFAEDTIRRSAELLLAPIGSRLYRRVALGQSHHKPIVDFAHRRAHSNASPAQPSGNQCHYDTGRDLDFKSNAQPSSGRFCHRIPKAPTIQSFGN